MISLQVCNVFWIAFSVPFVHSQSLEYPLEMTSDQCPVEIKPEFFPNFSKPVIVGYYSVGINRKLLPGNTAKKLKYLHRDTIYGNEIHDLNVGFENYVGKRRTLENEDKIDLLLEWLYKEKYLYKVLDDKSLNPRYTFVCARGLLSTIMRTPYECQEGWIICATKIKNLIFLCAFYTDQKKEKQAVEQTEQEKRFEYWGFKFEQCLLTDDPTEKPNTSKSINSNEEFIMIYRSRLNNNNLIYGAEVDGIDSTQYVHDNINCSVLNRLKFMELKTSRHLEFIRQDVNFRRYKLIKWWCQSFLVGIENLTCGFRNDQGYVEEIRHYNIRDLPKLAEGMWNANACMQFLDDFLNYAKQTLINEPDNTTWRFDWSPRMQYFTRSKVTNESYVILPEWFSL